MMFHNKVLYHIFLKNVLIGFESHSAKLTVCFAVIYSTLTEEILDFSRVFATNSNFLIPMSLQPEGVNL